MKQLYVNIILPVPLKRTFTYSVPYNLNQDIEIGKRVKVSFGHKKLKTGLIIKIIEVKPSFKTKPIISLLDNEVLVKANNTYIRIGDFANVLIQKADHFDLYGVVD